MTMEEFNAELATALHLSSVDWLKYYIEAAEPIPEMHELVNWAAEHYGVGLLTNIMPGVVDRMRELGLLPDVPYDVIVDSSVVHSIKPEAKIYQIAAEKSKQAASEILLVDDTRSNLMAAEKSGWRVLWFDDYQAEESTERIREVLEPVNSAASPTVAAEPVVPAVVAPEEPATPVLPAASGFHQTSPMPALPRAW
jgi:HAD superfamily hydrolase (TIGR01509 family)